MDIQALLRQVIDWFMTSGLRILLILILGLIALRLARLVANRIFSAVKDTGLEAEAQKRAATLNSLVRYVLNIAIVTVIVVMILGEFGIKIGPILAAAGIVGLAVGFGSQQLVQDIISGFFILMEDQIRVGDVIQTAGKSGLVERVTLRMTVLRDLAGSVHYIRNGQVDIVTNMTKDFSFAVFDIGVAYREDVEEVIALITEVGEELESDAAIGSDIIAPMEVLGLDKFGDSAVIIKARIKTKPITQWNVARAFNLKLKKKFDEKNVEIPFPHVTLYMGEDKQGQAPPVHVAMTQN